MNSAVKHFRNVCCLMINLSKYQDMLVCQKTTNLFIILACGLVLLMPDCLFFLTTHVPEIFLMFVWVCGLSVKRSKQGFICLICQETLILPKRACIHTCMQENYYSSFLLGILKFFCIIYLLHFFPFYRTHPILECCGNFLAHHKLGIKIVSTVKRGHQK